MNDVLRKQLTKLKKDDVLLVKMTRNTIILLNPRNLKHSMCFVKPKKSKRGSK